MHVHALHGFVEDEESMGVSPRLKLTDKTVQTLSLLLLLFLYFVSMLMAEIVLHLKRNLDVLTLGRQVGPGSRITCASRGNTVGGCAPNGQRVHTGDNSQLAKHDVCHQRPGRGVKPGIHHRC